MIRLSTSGLEQITSKILIKGLLLCSKNRQIPQRTKQPGCILELEREGYEEARSKCRKKQTQTLPELGFSHSPMASFENDFLFSIVFPESPASPD